MAAARTNWLPFLEGITFHLPVFTSPCCCHYTQTRIIEVQYYACLYGSVSSSAVCLAALGVLVHRSLTKVHKYNWLFLVIYQPTIVRVVVARRRIYCICRSLSLGYSGQWTEPLLTVIKYYWHWTWLKFWYFKSTSKLHRKYTVRLT